MAKYSNVIEYKVKTVLDGTGLSKLQAELAKTENLLQSWTSKNTKSPRLKEWEQAIPVLEQVRTAINRAYNSDIKALNISKFNKDLDATSFKAKGVGTALSNAGYVGQKTFNTLVARTASLDTGLKNVNSTATKLLTTFKNTVRWGLSASLFEGFMSGAHEALEYVKDLDRSLNDIRIVSGYSADYMREFAKEANEAAVALGKTTTAYTDASLIYIQQGKTLEESKKLAELTLKTANVTGQETAEVSEQLTALMNGYQVAVDDMEASVDKLAKVAAVGASDMEELATAASRVSSTANALGVSQDQLIAQLSTIISVTRLAPETVGNSLKTIFARLGDLKMGETLEDGVDMGSIGKTLDLIGIKITDTTGELRNMGDVLEELMVRWDDLSTAEQQAVAVKLAGKYQYNNLIALLENAEMYNEQLEASETSLGTINEQQQVYLESLEAKLESLTSSFEGFISSIFNPDDIKPFMDVLIDGIKLMTQFTDSIGGGATLLTGLSGIATKTFGNTIAKDIVRQRVNRTQRQVALENADATQALIEALGVEGGSKVTKNSQTYKYAQDNARYFAMMDDEQRAEYKASLQEYAAHENSRIDIYEKTTDTIDYFNRLSTLANVNQPVITIGEDGKLNVNQEAYDDTRLFAESTLKTGKFADTLLDLVNGTGKEDDKKYLAGDFADLSGKLLNEYKPLIEKRDSGQGLTDDENKLLGDLDNEIARTLKGVKRGVKNAAENYVGSETGEELMATWRSMSNLSSKNIGNGAENIDKLASALEKFFNKIQAITINAERTSQNLKDEVANNPLPDDDKLRELLRENAAATQSKEQDALRMQQETERRAAQERVAQYVSITAAIQQMAAAVQAFHNLGSIWSDEDLTAGEKILQTITSLTTTIVMASQAVREFKEATAMLNEIGVMGDIKLGGKGKISQTINKSLVSLAPTIANGLGKAISVAGKFIPHVMFASLVYSLVDGIIGGIQEAQQKQRAARIEEYESTKQQYDDSRAQYDEFVKLRDEYKQTGEASASFVSTLESLGKSLDVSGSQAMLAGKQYDSLSDAIVRNMKLENSRQLGEAKQNYKDVVDENKDALKQFGDSIYSWNIPDDAKVVNDSYNQGKAELEETARENAGYAIENGIVGNVDVSESNVRLVGKVLLNITDPIPVSTSELVAIADEKNLRINLKGNIVLDSNKVLTPEQFYAYYSNHLSLTNTDGQITKITLLDLLNCKTDEEFRALLAEQEYITFVNPDTEEKIKVPITDVISPAQVQEALDSADIAELSTEGFVGLCNAIWTKASDTVAAQIDDTTLLAKTDESGNIATIVDLSTIQDVILTKAIDGIASAEVDGELTQEEYNAAVLSALDSVLEPLGFSSEDLPDTVVQQIKDGYAGVAAGEADALSTAFAQAITGAIPEVDTSIFASVKTTLQNAADAIGKWFEDLADGWADLTHNMSDTLGGDADTYALTGAAGVSAEYRERTKNGPLDWFGGATLDEEKFNELKGIYAELYRINPDETWRLGTMLNEGFVNGLIGEDTSEFKDKILEVYGQEIWDLIAAFWEVHSPSRRAKRLAGYIVQGGIEGASEKSDELVKALVSPYEEAAGEIGDVKFNDPGVGGLQEHDYGKVIGSDDAYGALREIYSQTGIHSIVNGVDLTTTEGLTVAFEIVNSLSDYAVGLKKYRDAFSEDTDEYVKANAVLEAVNERLEIFKGQLQEVGDVTDALVSIGQLSMTNLSLSTDMSGMSTLEAYNYLTGDDFERASGFSWGSLVEALGGSEVNAMASLAPYLYDVDSDKLVQQAVMAEFDKNNGTYTTDMSVEAQAGRTSTQLIMAGANANVDPDIYANAVIDLMRASNDGAVADTGALFANFGDVVGNMDNIPSTIADYIVSSLSYEDLENEDTIRAAMTEGYRGYFEEGTRTERDSIVSENDERREATHSIVNDGLTNESAKALLPSNITDMFDDAAAKSDALSESIALLSNNTFEAQRDLLEMDSAVESVDYAAQRKSIDEVSSSLDELKSKSVAEINLELNTNFSSDDIEDIIDDLTDEFETQTLTLDVDVAGDFLDKADGLINAMGDVENAASLIGEGFIVSADDLQTVLSVFPELNQGLEILADGSARVNQEILQGVLDTTSASVQASAEEQAAKLENLGNYAVAMSEMYQNQATAYAMLCDTNEENDTQATQSMIDIEAGANDIYQEIFGERDAASETLAINEGNYASDAGSNIAGAMASADDAVANSLSNMTSNAGSAFYDISAKAVQMAQTIATAISNPESATNLVDAGGISLSGAGNNYAYEATVEAGQEITIGGKQYTVGDKEGQTDYAAEAQQNQALADAYRNMANELFTKANILRSSSAGALSGLGNAGYGSGSGGSDSGGGGSEYSPKTKEYQEDEIDRYEKVDTLLDAITADYEKLNAEQERLIGLDLADNITEQIYLLRQQIDLQKEKLGIQKEEAEEYRKELADRFGVQFNDDGFITNYAERYKAILGTLNDLITAYNSTATEEGQEALEEQIDFAQETYDDFVDLIDKYDEMISSTIKDTEQQLEDLEDEIEDLNISMFQKAVESTDSIKDLNEALIDFNAAFSGLDSDNPFREMEVSAKKLAGYFDVAADSADAYYDTLEERYKELIGREGVSAGQKTFYQQQIDLLNEARKSAGQGTMEQFGTGYLDLSVMSVASIAEQIRQFEENGVSEIFGKNSADLYDTAKSVFEQATDLIADYEGEVDTLRDAIVSAIDDVAERMDERKEQYEAIVDALEHQASIIQMIHGDQAYEKLNQVLSAQQYTYRQQIAESQQQIEYWEELLGHMKEGSEEYKSIQEQITSTQSSLNDLIETSLENLQQQYTNIVNKITDQWAFSAMGNDLDWIAQEWELINRNADYYLDDVNAAYNIQKLQADYLDLLDDATSLDVQQQITEQMGQQLGYLREKEKLSEYDVAYAQAQLEILQRQIALQEAQANKSQMKLRRDSQGNYSYVYTADEDDVKSAQGDLLDAQNNAYNLSKDQMKATQDDSISALQEAQDLINNLWTNANLTLDQKKERTQAIIDSLKEYLAGTSEQLSTSEKNIINDFIGMAEILTDENRDRMDDVYQEIISGNKDAFDQIDTRWSTSITAWLTNMEQFNNSTDDMFADLVNGADEYQSQIDDIADLVKQDFDDMSDSIQNCVDKTNNLAMSNADFINQLREDSGVIREYEDRLQDYASRIADAQNAMRSYQTQVNELQGQLVAKEQENTNLTGQIQDLYDQINFGKGNGSAAGGSGDGSGTIGTGGAAGYGTSDMAFGIAQNIWTYGVSGGWGNNPIRSGKLTDAYGIDFAQTVQEIINARIAQGREGELVDFDSKKFSSYSLIGYDTGGYTGDWGDGSGRLALLHTKELVLNQGDTDNILQAVQAVRAMTAEIKGDALNRMVEFVSRQAGSVGTASETIDQEVHITATFPNATSADDIREAILGLNGQVLQYAHRK